MLDGWARSRAEPATQQLAAIADRAGGTATQVTALAWLLGVGSCVALARSMWTLAIVLWLLNRTLDGVDGALARRQGPTEWGGLLDLLADFSIYAGFLLGLAIAVPDVRLPALALLSSYYLSGAVLLATSSLLARREEDPPDGRSLHLRGGLAEGTETILVYVALLVFHQHAVLILWGFTAAVVVTLGQRLQFARAALSRDPASARLTAKT